MRKTIHLNKGFFTASWLNQSSYIYIQTSSKTMDKKWSCSTRVPRYLRWFLSLLPPSLMRTCFPIFEGKTGTTLEGFKNKLWDGFRVHRQGIIRALLDARNIVREKLYRLEACGIRSAVPSSSREISARVIDYWCLSIVDRTNKKNQKLRCAIIFIIKIIFSWYGLQ